MLTSITVFPSIPRRTATLVTPRGIPAGALLTGSVTAFGGCKTMHFADNVCLFVNNSAKFTLRTRKNKDLFLHWQVNTPPIQYQTCKKNL